MTRPGSAIALHHVIEGPAGAQVVLMMHPLGSSLMMWQPQAEALAARYRVVRCDLRGHGRSPVPPGPYEIDDLGADVVALLDRLEIRRAHLCGLSLGGMVGMWLAANHPDRVGRMVVCCTSAQLGPPERWIERAALVREGGTEAVADSVIDRWFTPGFRDRRPDRAAELRATITATPPAGYIACCGAIERMDLRAELPRIKAPTLAIAGAEDRATTPDHLFRIAEGIPGARAAVVDGAAHVGNIEQPEEFTALIAAHFRQEPDA